MRPELLEVCRGIRCVANEGERAYVASREAGTGPSALNEQDQTAMGEVIAKTVVEEYRKDLQMALVDIAFWKTCLNCDKWFANGCKEAGGQVPPPLVILHGCPIWQPVVPF